VRVLWFGSYAKGPGYPRSETLIAGLRELGNDVEEVHVPLFEGAADRVDLGAGRGAARTAWRQAIAAVRLAARWFRAGEHDVAVAGAGGVADAALLRFLQGFARVPLVVDEFIPLYDTVVRDRRLAAPDSARARMLLRAERLSARVADVVLSDTSAQAELLAADLRVDRAKIAVVPVAQPDPGPPAPLPGDGPLRVLLVATHIPLHGVATVVDAAVRLAGSGVSIRVVGAGQGLAEIAARAADVPALELVPRFVPEDEVRSMLAASHVGLGIFGDTEKAARVVPLKAALVTSCGRALVTRDGPAASEALGGAAVLVAPADAAALAEALVRLRDDRTALARLAAEGRRRYEERFTPRAAASRLVAALEPFVTRRGA
jgi:glycosyltransferase involved in cell wall biosynthesis